MDLISIHQPQLGAFYSLLASGETSNKKIFLEDNTNNCMKYEYSLQHKVVMQVEGKLVPEITYGSWVARLI